MKITQALTKIRRQVLTHLQIKTDTPALLIQSK